MSWFNTKERKQVLLLYLTSLVGVFLGVGVSVLNTRSLSVFDYGDVRYVNNIISFIGSLLLFGYFVSGSRLLALSPNKEVSRKIYGALTIVLLCAICLNVVAMFFCYLVHLEWFNHNVAYLFLLSMPVCAAPLLLSFVNTSFQGDNRIGSIALARLLPSLLYLVVGSMIYSMYGTSASIMLLLQNGIAVIVYVILIVLIKPNFHGIRKSLYGLQEENKRYGFPVYIGSVAAVSLNYLAGITLGVFNSNNALVGFYTLALTVTSPLAMLPAIVGTVYFKSFAHKDRIERKVLRDTIFISVVTLLLFIVLIYPIVNVLYDKTYSSVAAIASFLAIGTTVHGIGDMFNRFLGAHGRGKDLRNGAILCGVIILLGNIVFVYFWDINGAILTKILSSSVYAAAMVLCYLKFRKRGI